jgi:hypothetical protein
MAISGVLLIPAHIAHGRRNKLAIARTKQHKNYPTPKNVPNRLYVILYRTAMEAAAATTWPAQVHADNVTQAGCQLEHHLSVTR